jgi:hypothetical protein
MKIPLRAGCLLDERDGPDAEKAIGSARDAFLGMLTAQALIRADRIPRTLG